MNDRLVSRRSLAAGAAALLALAAMHGSSRAEGNPAASPVASPVPGPRLLLRMESSGGLQPRETTLLQVPDFSLYDDGSIYRLGPVAAIYPPAALPNLTRMRISAAGIETVMARALDAGLDEDQTIRNLQVMDAPSTRFTFNNDGERVVTTVTPLFIDTDRPADWSDETAAAFQSLRAFGDFLNNLLGELPPEAIIEQEMPRDPERLQVVAFEPNPDAPLPSGTPDLSQPPLTWPLDVSLAELGAVYTPFSGGQMPTLRCAEISGDDAAAVVKRSREGNFASPWIDGDTTYGLLLKPLLPDQSGCTVETSS